MIDTLVENDVVVVDLFGKVKDGTFAGDNLSTAIHARSKTGMVVDGGMRDLARIYEIPDFAVFIRGVTARKVCGRSFIVRPCLANKPNSLMRSASVQSGAPNNTQEAKICW